MIDAKKEAKEFVDLYCQLLSIRDYEDKERAKQCALIAVGRIIRICENEIISCSDKTFFYYLRVKTEIEKL
jgi:hypothetical protein